MSSPSFSLALARSVTRLACVLLSLACGFCVMGPAAAVSTSYGQASINSKRPEPSKRNTDPRRTQSWKFLWAADETRPVDRIVINITEQKVYAYQDGKIVLDTPCSTGKPGHSTPTGSWRIIFKNANHYSGSYGSVVNANGQVINGDATPGSYVPPGGAYLRAPMPYFMRFVGGIGLHTGFLPGYPASHGCIRLPNEAAKRLFAAAPMGTPVTVTR